MSKTQSTNYELQSTKQLRVAIVDDWLTNAAGKERVTLALHKMFPDAPIYTSVYDPEGPGMEVFAGADVRTSFIQRLPWAKTHHQLFPVLRRFAFERFDFSEFDLVISSSGAEAKGIKMPVASRSQLVDSKNLTTNSQLLTTPKRPIHVSYCHSPTHYYWVRPDEYLSSSTMGWLGKILRLGLRVLIKPMRRWDYLAAQRPDVMIANSMLTQDRIKRYYDREAEVIFPPVDTKRFAPPKDPPKRKGFVSLGRQVHYMRRDIAVAACSELGILLRVIGRGPEHEYLKSIAGPTIEFYDDLTDEEVAEALWHAEGLISCGVEDFGITAVEALAAGTPVVALAGGGTEDIIDLNSGLFFPEQSVESLKEALTLFASISFKPKQLSAQAERFSSEVFVNKLEKLIDKTLSSSVSADATKY